MWTRHFQNFPYANQETNATIESYHGLLKIRFLSDKMKKSGRRLDWLIYTLLKHVESYYRNKDLLKSVGFNR